MHRVPRYRHSGRVSPFGLLGGLGAASALGSLLGATYAVAIAYIPIIILNVVLTLTFGGAVGFAVAVAMKRGKVRNTAVTVLVALAVTALAHYVGWMVWVGLMFLRANAEVPVLEILDPSTLGPLIGEINEVGVWSLGGSGRPVAGVALGVVWVLEALLVFATSLAVACSAAGADPFCEGCASWCRPHEGVLRLTGMADGEALRSRLEAGDLAVLAETPRAVEGERRRFVVDLHACAVCGRTNTLSLTRADRTPDAKGRARTRLTPLVELQLLTADQARWIENLPR